jgi:maltooligosyltrehalose trehalohydrolase
VVLDWQACNEQAGKKRLALVRQLLAIRHREIAPRLAGAAFGDAHAADNGLLTASWRMGDGAVLRLLANLSNTALARGPDETTGTAIWGGKPGNALSPWSVFWSLGAR